MLSQETVDHLLRIKNEIEEILAEVGDILPPDFRMTCVLRYCGTEEGVEDMIWTDDVPEDVIPVLKQWGDRTEAV